MAVRVMMSWRTKLAIAIAVDLFDFVFGRVLVIVPFSNEVIGTVVGVWLFGWKGLFYLIEAIDPTEQIDGFVPTATLIALACRPRKAA